MNKKEKLILLCELLNYNVNDLIKDKTVEFKNSNVMKQIGVLIKDNNLDISPSFLSIKKKYDQLRVTEIKSEEEYFLALTKAYALLNELKKKSYINPLLICNYQDMPLKDLVILFDGKEALLGDVILSENYTDDYLIDSIKNQIIVWRKEADDVIVRPLQLLLTYPKNLPKKHKITFNRIIIAAFLIILSLGFLFSFFIPNNYFYDVLHFKSNKLYIIIPYYIFASTLFLYDFFFVLFLLLRNNDLSLYFYAQKNVLYSANKIIHKLNKNASKLYKKLLKCIKKKQEIHGRVDTYTLGFKKLYSLNYMKEVNEKNYSLYEDHFSTYELALIEIIFILVIYFIFIFFLERIGVIIQ